MARTTEAFSRVRINALLTDAGWNLTDGTSVLFEHALPDGSRAESEEATRSRRKLLIEMATGTGKTRAAAAFIKRLFEAGAVTRVLFLVDRVALAAQTEDAVPDPLRDYPRHVLRPGRGFDRAKRITIATLQTMIAEHGRFSSGYSDLVITDAILFGRYSSGCRPSR